MGAHTCGVPGLTPAVHRGSHLWHTRMHTCGASAHTPGRTPELTPQRTCRLACTPLFKLPISRSWITAQLELVPRKPPLPPAQDHGAGFEGPVRKQLLNHSWSQDQPVSQKTALFPTFFFSETYPDVYQNLKEPLPILPDSSLSTPTLCFTLQQTACFCTRIMFTGAHGPRHARLPSAVGLAPARPARPRTHPLPYLLPWKPLTCPPWEAAPSTPGGPASIAAPASAGITGKSVCPLQQASGLLSQGPAASSLC